MMIIRLTSEEYFDKVLEKLKQDEFYMEAYNYNFFKYCVPFIREELNKGDDELYLDIEWVTNNAYGIVMIIRYHKRSDIQTDKMYLDEE